MWLVFFLALITLALAYVFWIRPILRLNEHFAVLLDQEDSFWTAVREKFIGIKGKLTFAFSAIAAVVVEMHDFIVPLAQESGADVQTLLPKVPGWVWPFITMALLALLQWFRHLSEKRPAQD